MAAKFMAKLACRPVKATYDLATLRAKTQHGGEVVTASTDIEMEGHRIARVGDVVRYPDGTESKIISGAGLQRPPCGDWGQRTDIGDTIISSLQNSARIQE